MHFITKCRFYENHEETNECVDVVRSHLFLNRLNEEKLKMHNVPSQGKCMLLGGETDGMGWVSDLILVWGTIWLSIYVIFGSCLSSVSLGI